MEKVSSWKELTLREKIGQTVICFCEVDKHIEKFGSVEAFLERYPVGGLFNNGGLVKGLLTGANKDYRQIVERYNKHLRVPLFTAADQGTFAQLHGIGLPSQMSIGATDDESMAYKAGEFQAENFAQSGINWGFWPCCDLNISRLSPVIDTRSVGDTPDLSVKIVKEEIRAMKDRGVIATIKHYPGVPYDDYVDSHLAPCDNETPFEYWMQTYGKMYKKLFESGVPAVMTGHVNLTDYQKEKIDGSCPPATMSYELTTKLLREELGFEGVTVTDALNMGGFCGENALENTVRSFLAGNDVLLWPMYEYIDEMERRILNGEIDEKILDTAVERIWNLKKEYGILDGKPFESYESAEFYQRRARDISEKCLTLLNNHDNMLPLGKNKIKNVCVIAVTPDDNEYKILSCMKGEFEKYGCNVTFRRNAWLNDVEEAAEKNDLIIFALSRTVHHPIGPLDFWGEEATTVWTSNSSDKNKTVIANFGSPYIYRYYKKSGITYVNCYTPSKDTVAAFVKAVFGEIEFEGKSTVKLK